MPLIINLVPIRAGGGLQNTLSFLNFFHLHSPFDPSQYLIICNMNSEIADYCAEYNLNFFAIPNSKLARIKYELFYGMYLFRKHHADTVFSIFGGAPLISFGVRKISGFAYSNLIQPEVPFWNFLPFRKRIWKLLIDKLRLFLAKHSDELILETDYLSYRAKQGIFSGKIIHTIKMAPSAVVLSSLYATKKPSRESSNDTKRILYLSGPHKNKRIHLLARVFQQLNNNKQRYILLTTLPESSSYLDEIKREFAEAGVSSFLSNLGPVPASNLGDLLRSVDGMINVALLESFSNNWVEAWAVGIPLITTDADWARASCGDAAIYVNPESPDIAAERILAVFSSRERMKTMQQLGFRQLDSLPTPEGKFWQYISIIKGSKKDIR